MLHIIFLSPHSDPQADLGEPDSGGQCIYEHELALALSALPDFKVTTFCRQNFIRPDENVINNSYSIRRITCGSEQHAVPKEVLEPLLPEFIRKVSEIIQREFAEDQVILHGHYWDGAYAALGLKSMCDHKLPFIWTPHSLGSTKQRKFPGDENEWTYNFIPRRCWESYGCVAADSVILSSQEERDSLVYDYAIDPQKIQIISPGINLPQFERIPQDEARRLHDLPADEKILVCLGRMVRSKGYHHAIHTLAELRKIYTSPVRLVIFGGSANANNATEQAYVQSLKDLAQELDVTDFVTFRPAIEHARVNEVFSAADVFLMTSEHEPFGLVTLEAMATKLPVVAANSGGSLSLIVHNQTGILVNFNQPDRAARYVLSLLKDEHLHERISEKSYRYVRREYDWYPKSSRFAQAYRQISRYQEVEDFQKHRDQTHFLKLHFPG